MQITRWLFTALLISTFGVCLHAKQELVTLPERDTVQLTIYNSVDLTLVRETRELTFREGNNRLQFSWANTLIDPTSVEFMALTHGDKLEVLDTSYPAQSHEMLIWTIHADEAVSARVEISYFTSGISWSAEYHGVLSTQEDRMKLTAYVTVTNNSGEEYENAQVRLVVGTIHIVESIASLAGAARAENLKKAYSGMREAESSQGQRKDIVKEGLSEYYIYTVEGHETIPNRWSKRLESFVQEDVPVRTVYTLAAGRPATQLMKRLMFKNDEAHKLGNEPLPAGIVRLYRDAGNGRLGFVGSLTTDYIPKNDEVKINAGVDPEVQLKSKRLSYKRESLVFRFVGERQMLAGWDVVEEFELELKNFRGRAIEFEIDIRLAGDFDFESLAPSTKIDFQTQRFVVDLKANSSATIKYTVRTRNGSNVRNR